MPNLVSLLKIWYSMMAFSVGGQRLGLSFMPLLQLTFLLVSLGGVQGHSEPIDYCLLPCGNIMHTLCNSACVGGACTPLDPDPAWRTRVLDLHNQLRQRVATGRETRGGNSAASDMRALSYDMHLEYGSACWIYEAGAPQHDVCRRSPNFTQVGQNIWIGREDVTSPEGIETFINFWYGQADLVNKELLDDFRNPHWLVSYRDFTQLAWAETSHVGCGRCLTKDNYSLVGCNYGPGGNRVGQKVYSRGPPASACPSHVGPNKQYLGLCGNTHVPEGFNEKGVLWSYDNHAVDTSSRELGWYFIVCVAGGILLSRVLTFRVYVDS